MSWRGLVVAVLLALVGAAAGLGIARSLDTDPVTIAEVSPVLATDPSVPADRPVQVVPDPATPPLAEALRSHVEQVGQPPFALRLPVPNGWVRSNAKAGEWRWFVEDNPPFTYVLRVVLPSGYTTIATALETRIAALAGAIGIQDFQVESETDDTFVASYVTEQHRRLTMERFLSLDESSQTVYANISLTGRMADRAGMTAMLERITAGVSR